MSTADAQTPAVENIQTEPEVKPKSRVGRPRKDAKPVVPPLTDAQIRELEERRIKEAYEVVRKNEEQLQAEIQQAKKEVEEFAFAKLSPFGLKLGVITEPVKSYISLVPLNQK